MAVSIANLTQGSDEDGGSGSSTASVSPSADKLQLLTVGSRTGITADPNQPTVTGNGLTWVAVNTTVYDNSSSSRRRVTVFRAMGASPSAGAIAIDFGGQNQTNVTWILDEFTGMDTTGTNGSGAVVQSAVNQDVDGGVLTLTVTLAAFGDAGNATFGAFSVDNGSATTAAGAGGFALSGDIASSTGIKTSSEFRNDNDTSVSMDWSGVVDVIVGGVAIEIKVAAVVSSDFLPRLNLMGVG